MKASEAIAKLQDLIATHGDYDVVISGYIWYCDYENNPRETRVPPQSIIDIVPVNTNRDIKKFSAITNPL